MNKTIFKVLSLTVAWATSLIPFIVYSQNHAIVPTTPEAANFSKVVNYPVTPNTGLPDISIPLHEIEIGGMKLPIVLSYQPGGFKIGEKSTNVGLGWSLSTDIQITRTINGSDDFGQFGYANNSFIFPFGYSDNGLTGYFYPTNNMTTSDSYSLASGLVDGKPDKFSYRLLNKSGSFYIMKNGSSYSFVPVPYDNIQISFNLHQFIITDVDGTVYYFSLPIAPANTNDNAQGSREYTGVISWNGGICENCSITTWKCLRIVNPTATDAIDFKYVTRSITTTTTSTDFVEYFNNPNPICNSLYYPNSTAVTSAVDYTSLLNNVGFFQNLSSPKYMEYKEGYGSLFHMIWQDPADTTKVNDKTFNVNYVGNSPKRSSYYNVQGVALSSIQFRGGSVTFNGTDQLSSITINNQGQELKTIRFYQSLTAPVNLTMARSFNGANFNGTLYLDSLSFTNGANKYETYGFQYMNKFCFGNHLKGHDAWGYVNAKTMEIAFAQFNGYPPFYSSQSISQTYYNYTCGTRPITVSLNGFGDEYPDSYLMRSGMLSSISYPTGGHVDFDFEANRYSASYTDNLGTSKRLMLGGGLRIQKITYYDGINLYTPSSQQYYTYGDLEDGEGILLNPPSLQYVDGKPLYGNYSFTQVVYAGQSIAPLNTGVPGSIDFPPLFVPCTSNNCILLTSKENKTTYLPNSALDLTYAGGSSIYYNKVTEYQQDYGRQAGKTVYTYYPVDYYRGYLSITPTISSIIPGTDDKYLRESWYMGKLKSEAHYKYDYQSATFSLIHQNNYEYTRYLLPQWPRVIYSFLHNFYTIIQPGSMTQADCYLNTPYSTGSIMVGADNFIFSEDGIPIGQMLISKKTEQWTAPTNDTLSYTTQYYYDNPNYLQPSRIMTTDSKGLVRTHQLKYPYDYPMDSTLQRMVSRNMISPVIEEIVTHGNTSEYSRSRTNYAYRNNWFYVPDSRYTSFNGNPLELETTFNQYDNFGHILAMTGRDGISKSYLWGYNSRYPVAEISGMDYNMAVANSGINLTVVGNPASDAQLMTELNKLRTMPGPPTLVKSFTYKPMTGITSLTDPAGISSYFEYDAFNRLLNVRDNNNNLTKRFEYSMAGPTSVPRFSTNKPLMITVCNCYIEPSTGPGNNYIVPGGTNISSWDYPGVDFNTYANMADIVGNGTVSTACANDTSNHAAVIKLTTWIYLFNPNTIRPSDMMIEFVKDGSVIASQPYGRNDTTVKYFYIPEGTYQVSLRVDPSYRGRAIKFYLNGSDGTSMWLLPGATLTTKRKVTYSIQATNAF